MASALDEVRDGVDKTMAAGTARIMCVTTFTWAMPDISTRQRGPIWRAVVTSSVAAARVVGRPLLRLASGRADLRQFTGEGFIDFTGDRCMLDHGSYAQLQVGTKVWSGRSGRPITTLPAEPARVASPLWLIHLVAGAVNVIDEGIDEQDTQHARGRRFSLITDLAVASAACPGGMPSPPKDRFDELSELPVEVWLADGLVTQIRYITEHESTVVTMTDFGTDTERIDWQTLPSFASS